jgi:hypothetical protein
MTQLNVAVAESVTRPIDIGALVDIMTRTLPEGGIDRMTSRQIEELLAVPALTAHL